MAAESASGCKLTEFVTYHVFRDINRDKLITIMNCDGMAHEIRGYHRCSSPSLHNNFLAAFVHGKHLILELLINIRTFFMNVSFCT